jgi:hypothetical protein
VRDDLTQFVERLVTEMLAGKAWSWEDRRQVLQAIEDLYSEMVRFMAAEVEALKGKEELRNRYIAALENHQRTLQEGREAADRMSDMCDMALAMLPKVGSGTGNE